MGKEQKKLIREEFRTKVFARDNYRCVFCGHGDWDLDAHHIYDRHDFDNGGYFLENGVTLCPEHHQMAEDSFITRKEIYDVLGYGQEVIGFVLRQRRSW